MNKVILIGRLCKDPDIRYTQGENPMCIARYTLACDRITKKDGQPTADFISCVALGKQGEFAEKYLTKGMKIAVEGKIQTGSYEKDGQTIYTTEVLVERHEFVESKGSNASNSPQPTQETDADGFMNIPDGIEAELPFA